MTGFAIRLHGGPGGPRGTLLVDGHEPDLFGELVGCKVERAAPLDPPGQTPRLARIRQCRALTVEVTLRLPMGHGDRLTLVRPERIDVYHGPTSETRSTGPGAVALLDGWLAAHPGAPGALLIAKARELLTGSARD